MSGHTFTDAQRHALYHAQLLCETEVKRRRMSQAEAFCRGNDKTAERYDGPDGLLAPSVRDLSAINEMVDASTRDYIDRVLA